ncbi:MAG TPA: bifunctional nicotinamidase/pyrazinamidase [Roseiarcus sp.]|jgi:nicotinamidase/pyrazinamidase
MSLAVTIDASDALLVIDVQNDFVDGGALAVPGGASIVPLVNRLIGAFRQVVVTQDWHPGGHASFASSHPGAKPFEAAQLPYGPQVLWPDHCVQGEPGAELHEELDVDSAFLILRKGANADLDSYSAFTEADGKTTTGLDALLKARGIKRIFACGLATDFCVAYSALDARTAGFETFVIDDACRAIDADGSLDVAWSKMNSAGVWRIQARQILG